MKRLLKWVAGVILLLVVIGFCAFLYFIPPFFTTAPEAFSKPQNDAAPTTTGIADPAERALADRGRYLVMTAGCIGCHHTPGPQGPLFDTYLSGGLEFRTHERIFVSRNLMNDKETGLARRTDDEVKRVLRSGVFPDGHVVSYRVMPWGSYTSFTEEDRHAIVVYLRHMPAIRHQTPEPRAAEPFKDPLALEEAYGGKDYGTGPRSTK
jgi:hypothetical protein